MQGDQWGEVGRSTALRLGATLGITLEGLEMLKFSGVKNGRHFLGFGLSELNLQRLAQKEPIWSNLGPLGLPQLDVFIVYGVELDEPEGSLAEPEYREHAGDRGFAVPLEDVGDFVMFTGNRDGQDFIGFGLTLNNLEDLRSGTEFIQDLSICGVPEMDAVLTYGITEDAIQRRLEAESGLIPNHVLDLRTPEQKRNPRGFGQQN
jgi:hypothetical protein